MIYEFIKPRSDIYLLKNLSSLFVPPEADFRKTQTDLTDRVFKFFFTNFNTLPYMAIRGISFENL